MLRATLTKIKKACVIALVPRIVRGDGRYTTRKLGKTSINVLRKAGKSTDSNSKDGESECDKRRLIEFVFGSSKPKAITHIYKGADKTTVDNIQEIHKENEQAQAKADTLTEKQNRLLKEFFSADEDVVQQINYNKDLKLQAEAIKKHKLLKNRDNLDDDTLNARRMNDMPQSEGDKYYDHSDTKGSPETGKRFEKEPPGDYDEHKTSNPRGTDFHDYIPAMSSKLQATTAKVNEEKLSQKIEVLDETPHVEASSPKLEGCNIPSKVLGDRHFNFCNSTNTKSKSDFQGSLDEIAKKYMDTPASQIDEKIMQEIEKLGIQRKDEKKATIEKNVLQMDRLQSPEKPTHEVEIDLDNNYDKRQHLHCTDEHKLGPSFEMPPHLDQGRSTIEDESKSISYNTMQMNQETETFIEEKDACIQNNVDIYDSRPQYNINQPIIDPYDKKTLVSDTDELDEAVMDTKLLDDQRIGKPSENEESEHQAFVQSFKATSNAISSQQESRMPVMAEDSLNHHVQSLDDCAPREINWKPYPSFEAREEAMDFYSQQNVDLDSFKLNHTETIHPTPSELEPRCEKSYEPQPDHIYTSTSVPSESREQYSHSFVQPEEMINPLMDKNVTEPETVEVQPENIERNLSESLATLPSLNPDGNISLTELLRRVRMRNRMEYCREIAIHTLNISAIETLPAAEGKCGKKNPICPPPPPKCPPPSPCPPRPPACPPSPPPCPKPCKPPSKRPCPAPKKNPCQKFDVTSVRDIITLLTENNPQVKVPHTHLLPIIAYNNIHTPGLLKIELKEILKETLVCRLNILDKILLFHCTKAIDANLPRNRSELSFVRDYEPWTPIPSWPIPKKEQKKRFVCPKEGCKVFPPPKLNAPCKDNPCLNFPKRSKFSLSDLFTFSLLENLVCHIV